MAPEASEEEQAAIGKRLKAAFLAKTPALKKLKEAIHRLVSPVLFVKDGKYSRKVENPNYRPFLMGLDKRKLHVRSAHAALNTLLQSAGALIAKLATILAYEELIRRGHVWGKDFALVAHVHDEMQFEVRKGLEEEVGQVVVEAMREAGRQFDFRCPIDGEAKSGGSWFETH